MAGDVLSFALLAISSILIIVNPLGATLIYVSLTTNLDKPMRDSIARDSCRFAIFILLFVAVLGAWILQLFGISLEAFRIAGGILLFGIGMEMVYAKTSRTKLTATEKYESRDTEDIAIMPLAIPMIAGPGAITTTIVLMNEAIAPDTPCNRCGFSLDHPLHRDHLLYDEKFRLYPVENRTEGIPGNQPSDGHAAHCHCRAVCHHRDQDCISAAGRRIIMEDWDLTSVGLVLIGSSITVAGTIIGVCSLECPIPFAPFLLLTTAVLVVMSAVLIIFSMPKSPSQP